MQKYTLKIKSFPSLFCVLDVLISIQNCLGFKLLLKIIYILSALKYSQIWFSQGRAKTISNYKNVHETGFPVHVDNQLIYISRKK